MWAAICVPFFLHCLFPDAWDVPDQSPLPPPPWRSIVFDQSATGAQAMGTEQDMWGWAGPMDGAEGDQYGPTFSAGAKGAGGSAAWPAEAKQDEGKA